VYPHHLGVTIPLQEVNGFILFDPCLPSWWCLLTCLHLVIHPTYHTLHPYRQLPTELIILKLLRHIHVVPWFVFLGFAVLIGRNKSLLMSLDEYQILYIWTPWVTLVTPLALLSSDVFVSFCVFVFYRSIREEWQNFMWKCLEIQKSWKVDRSKFCPKSINRIKVDRSKFPRTYICRSALEHLIRSFSMKKSTSPSDFRNRTRWFHDLGCL
jgi:hypothetical protein